MECGEEADGLDGLFHVVYAEYVSPTLEGEAVERGCAVECLIGRDAESFPYHGLARYADKYWGFEALENAEVVKQFEVLLRGFCEAR